MPIDSGTAPAPCASPSLRLGRPEGLQIELLADGAIRRIDGAGVAVNLFPAHPAEGGPANLYLRRLAADGTVAAIVPLLGPRSPLRRQPPGPADGEPAMRCAFDGAWQGVQVCLQLVIADAATAWFWHLHLTNTGGAPLQLDAVLVQDVGLAPYGAIRLNEHYVSHYIDLAPLHDARHGWRVAARQNQAVDGRHPWLVMGALGDACAFATDGLQVHGPAMRDDDLPPGLRQALPATRLQHEHALIALQHAPLALAPRAQAGVGFFGALQADHPAATDAADLAAADAATALPEATPPPEPAAATAAPKAPRTLFATAPRLATLPLDDTAIAALFGPRQDAERADDGTLLSFFASGHRHVVLREKELRVLRPHGQILRAGQHLTPDESALTSTAWMCGVFHSMVTQGHVSINRFLSTVHGAFGQFRAHGQRAFVEVDGRWQLLGLPSAFEMAPGHCRWLYRHAGGLVALRSAAGATPDAMELTLEVLDGPPLRLLVSHHVALGGDDGQALPAPPLPVTASPQGLRIGLPAGSDLAARFPDGAFAIEPLPGSSFDRVGGDELLFDDGRPHGAPFVCVQTAAVSAFGLRLVGRLLGESVVPAAAPLSVPQLQPPPGQPRSGGVARLAAILPWYLQNALVHYLSPRGLEQYTGGGWGTRDICQGPLEMLLALDRTAPVRDLLLRLFAAQNADGDWPQWFSFFPREAAIRAGDSHGDIVFWPLLALARYLNASDDTAFLATPLPFHAADGAAVETASLRAHVERALAVIAARRIPGTALAAYGHGDWNDSLQPADPALREHLCSAWTVTLHHQVLRHLGAALRQAGDADAADRLAAESQAVRADFQRLLIDGGEVAGYALFAPGAPRQLLLHPSDTRTGVRHSLLPMMHAILEGLFDPAQAREHLALIRHHLLAPDGARLFDRPLPYRGGPQTLFQRAESSAFFGREIGLMYTHAHLRYAEALAHLGEADALLEALGLAHPIALRERLPAAALRQANCYYSSSDAAFADRAAASRDYARIAAGTVALDGGWRVYSSGPGIAIGLVVCQLLGVRHAARTLTFDPVLPPSCNGLVARLDVAGAATEITYRVGAAGHGPTRLVLNGAELPLRRGANPYRPGGAEVDRAAFVALRRGDGGDRLEILLG